MQLEDFGAWLEAFRPIARKIANQIFDQMLGLPSSALSPRSEEPDRSAWPLYVRLRLEDGRLYLYRKSLGKEMPCTPLDNARFAGEFGLAEFLTPENGAAPTLRLGLSFVFKRVDAPPKLREPGKA